MHDFFLDPKICSYCLEKTVALRSGKLRILGVAVKMLDEKLEPWEANLATEEEVKRRVYVAVSHFNGWHWQYRSATGLTEEQVRPHIAQLIEQGVLGKREDMRGLYSIVHGEALARFGDAVNRYHLEDDPEPWDGDDS